jgi:hypothetical protein
MGLLSIYFDVYRYRIPKAKERSSRLLLIAGARRRTQNGGTCSLQRGTEVRFWEVAVQDWSDDNPAEPSARGLSPKTLTLPPSPSATSL